MPQDAQLAVLFADVSGSTQIYETLGDVRARAVIARCIAVMTEAMRQAGGTLIKTIGDEIMATFPSADAAAEAACAMQDGITGAMVVEGRPMSIRVGFHYGSTLLEEGDVFGDAVNVAARMTAQAKAGQILLTGPTSALLTEPRRKHCRQIDLTQVKGKRDAIAIFELLWQPEDVTLMRAPWATRRRDAGQLILTIGATRQALGEGHPSLTIGRAEQNDLVVRNPVVSRLHARVEYRNGRFMLTDLSANGTFIQPDGGEPGYLHRDTQELTGAGTLALGEAADSTMRIRYEPE